MRIIEVGTSSDDTLSGWQSALWAYLLHSPARDREPQICLLAEWVVEDDASNDGEHAQDSKIKADNEQQDRCKKR